SSCAGANRLDLEIRRILSTRRVSVSLHKQSDRPSHGRAKFDRNLERKILRKPRGRNPRSAGQNVQGWTKALRLSTHRRNDWRDYYGNPGQSCAESSLVISVSDRQPICSADRRLSSRIFANSATRRVGKIA